MTTIHPENSQIIALVTGANRGLGKRFAGELLARGAKVYAAARRPETIDIPGVVPVQLTVFDWGGYRYSNARDAIAAAKRLSKAA